MFLSLFPSFSFFRHASQAAALKRKTRHLIPDAALCSREGEASLQNKGKEDYCRERRRVGGGEMGRDEGTGERIGKGAGVVKDKKMKK